HGFTPVVALLKDFITRILAEQQEDKRRCVSGMIWGIWLNMNEAVWKQNVTTVDQLVHHHRLEMGKLKCNVDGAIFMYNGCMGWLNSLHLNDVIMETDSQHLWQAFYSGYEDAFDLGLLLKDSVTIASSFQLFSFYWIRRDANKVTHVLARGALLRVNYMDCTICPFSIARIVNAEKLSNLYVNEGS
ncbi:hypothetical protein Golob_002359, partial [Gossypium lobatum]|nr:hypothetical protein [Gossypium lobatum]